MTVIYLFLILIILFFEYRLYLKFQQTKESGDIIRQTSIVIIMAIFGFIAIKLIGYLK